MRLLFSIFLLLTCNGLLHAQADSGNQLDTFSREPIPILVESMRYPEGVSPAIIEQIETKAYSLLEDHWHFTVVNHSTEENTGKVDPEYIFQLSLEPLIDDLSQSDIVDTNKQVTGMRFNFHVGVSANLRVTDITTGELKYTRDIRVSQRSSGVKDYGRRVFRLDGIMRPYPSNPAREALLLQDLKDDLLEKSLRGWGTSWTQELNSIFPSLIHLVAVLDGSAKRPKKLRIDGGDDFGLKRNDYLDIITLKVYEAMGERFVRYEKIGFFYPREISTTSCVGNIFGGRKAVGRALAAGQEVFFRRAVIPTRN